ncbi:MAG TPA: hypothetical protein VK363_16630 [Pyrinomonadaceae bacterium]|nr:hypothetical protein [Pyrinomonadaceae bacterium]
MPNLRDRQAQNDVFEQSAAYQQGNFSLMWSDLPERSAGASVTANFFDVFLTRDEAGACVRRG